MPNPLLPGLQLQPLPYHDRLPLRDPATPIQVLTAQILADTPIP